MIGWELDSEDLKHYPHFDAELGLEKARKLVLNADLVAKNSFYPFIKYEKGWQPFRTKEPRPEKKVRPIRYAARKDAYILSYYRSILSEAYERKLLERGICFPILPWPA